MSSELFAEDIINPVLFFMALVGIGYICISAVLSWYQASKAEQQVEQVETNGPVRELAQQMYPCPYCDVHEQANWVAYEAWQKGSKQR